MYKKTAVICLLMVSLLLYCSCLKREHTHPLDPVTKGDEAGSAVTPTLTPDAGLPTNTVPPTDTFTPVDTFTPTEVPTVGLDAWLDRGEITGDLPGGSGVNESMVDPAIYPNINATDSFASNYCSAPGVLSFSGNGFMPWSPGCTSCTSDSSTGMAYNYSSDFFAETGSLRLTGKMSGYTWGGWGGYTFTPCGNWIAVDISAYTGLSFYGRFISGAPAVNIAISEVFFDGIQYDDDAYQGLDSYSYDTTLTGSWNLHEIPFASMDSGWKSYLPITGPPFNRYTPGVTNLKTDAIRVSPGSGPYNFLIDEFKFY